MLHRHMPVFKQSSDPSERVLHRGRIIGVEGGITAAWFESEDASIETGEEFLFYFEVDAKKLKQRACGVSVSVMDRGVEVTFETSGKPEAAEERADYRASAQGGEVHASLGGEELSAVLDVSAAGIAVWSTRELPVGSDHEVSLRFGDEVVAGRMLVASARSVTGELIRYGLRADEPADAPLMLMLRRVNVHLQRQQLARLSGRA